MASIWFSVPVLRTLEYGTHLSVSSAVVTDTDHSVDNNNTAHLWPLALGIRQVKTGLSECRTTPTLPLYHHLVLLQVNSASHCGRGLSAFTDYDYRVRTPQCLWCTACTTIWSCKPDHAMWIRIGRQFCFSSLATSLSLYSVLRSTTS